MCGINFQAITVADLLKLIGALIVFGIGLSQYRQAQKWKRREFIAAQIKDFEADRKIQLTMAMLDWQDRELFFPIDKSKEPFPIVVTDSLLCSALLYHEDAASYPFEEQIIRDCFDRYLDMLVRLYAFVKANLIRVDELEPYLKYWVEVTAGQKPGRHQKEVFTLLLNYIQRYEFNGATKLIEYFRFNAVPDPAEVQSAVRVGLDHRKDIRRQDESS